MKILFDGIPLDTMSVSMTMNGVVRQLAPFWSSNSWQRWRFMLTHSEVDGYDDPIIISNDVYP